MGGPDGHGCFNVLDFLPEFLNFADAGGERHGISGGAEADGLVGVVHGLGDDRDAAEHESLKFLTGEVGGLFANAGQLDAEMVVFKPAIQSALTDAGLAGGLSYGRGGCNDGQGGLLAKGEAGFFISLPFSFISSRSGSTVWIPASAGMTGLGRDSAGPEEDSGGCEEDSGGCEGGFGGCGSGSRRLLFGRRLVIKHHVASVAQLDLLTSRGR